jgi:hypothetical protein
MSYKDTLELYDELMAGGCTETQARVQAKQLGSIGTVLDSMNTKLDKIDKDLVWMRVIGAAMTLAFLSAWFK